MISLRVRVALVTTGVVVLLLGSGSALIGWRICAALDREFDLLTEQRLIAAASGIEFEHGGIEIHGQGVAVTALAVVNDRGERISGPEWLRPPGKLVVGSSPLLGGVLTEAGESCRTAWIRIQPENDDQERRGALDVGIAMSTQDLQEQQDIITGTLVVGGLIVAIAVILTLSLVLGRLLAPHARLAEQVGGLDPRQPGQRLDVSHLPRELRGIAERINDLCERLERAYGLSSSFHAAAAHELRTPLAGLRATIEVAAQPGGDPTAALTTCHGITLQMQARVDNLLMAARIDSGQLVQRRDEVDVHAMLQQAWEQVAEFATTRGLHPVWELSGNGLAIADPEGLRMVLANLFDNAVSHASSKGVLNIVCADVGSRLTISLTNSAAGMSPRAAAQVFERGWRSTSSSPDSRHAGLGLSIARELVGLMNGQIEIRLEDGLFCVEVDLPMPGLFEYW